MAPRLFWLVSMVFVVMEPCVHASTDLTNDTSVDITSSGCGTTKFCVEDPEGCDPATNSCLFASIMAGPVEPSNGSNLSITLKGESSGYIALRLTGNDSVGTTLEFVCANMNEKFEFISKEKDNSNEDSDTPVEDIQGQLNGSVIQCSFTVPHANAMALGNSHVTTFVVELGTGTINGSTRDPFSLQKTVGPVDVADLTPLNSTMTPMNSTAMPWNSTMTPMNSTAMPWNSTMTPMNSTAMPWNSTMTPMNSTTTPMYNYTTTPMINTTMPTNVTTSQNTTSTSSTSPLSSSASLLLCSFLSWRAVLSV